MADKKISQLSNASTPLAGTEVLPIVQSSATVKVAANDLTVRNVRANATTGILQVTGPAAASTRVMTVPDANFTAARTDAAQTFTGDQTFGTILGTTFDTNVAAAKVTLSGTTLAASGTDTNIGVTITPKGTGNTTLTTGNLVVADGAGIDFSATPGTGTSELFDDYEEGTWTPAFAAWATAPTFFDARYIKIGSQVTVILLGQNGVNAGAQAITGLPFTNSNAVCPTGALKVFGSATLSSLCNIDTSAASINSFSAATLTGNYWSLSITYFVTF